MLFKSLSAAVLALSSALFAPSSSLSGPPNSRITADSARRVLDAVLRGRAATTGVNGTARSSARGSSSARIPRGQLPPAGMCRVWIQGVPPGHQPAVTDCANAQIQSAQIPNSQVIYGDQQSFPGKGKGKWNKSHGGDDQNGVGNDDQGDNGTVLGTNGNGDDDESGVGSGDQDEGQGRAGRDQSAAQPGRSQDARGGRPSWAGIGRGNSRGHGKHGG